MLEIYKKGQGKYTRSLTFAAAVMIGIIGAYVLSNELYGWVVTQTPYIRFGIPTLVVVALAWVMFWLVNRPQSADFLIATESEMKKVSWSSKKEIIGSTKVVITFTFIMAAILYAVDVLFVFLFKLSGISSY